MKGMPFPFDFEGKGVLDLDLLVKNKSFFTDNNNTSSPFLLKQQNCFVSSFCEPTSVLDSGKFPSRPTSSSTLSSSHGGGGSTGGGGGADMVGVAAVSETNPSPKWHRQDSTTATSSDAGAGADSELLPVPPSIEIGTAAGTGEKCGMEDWENVLSGSVDASPVQEQSIFRWIMGDVEDPSMGSLNKVLQIGGGGGGSVASAAEYEFTGGVMDQGFVRNVDNFGGNFMASAVNPSSFTNRSVSNLPGNFLKFPVPYPSSSVPNNGGLINPQAAFESSTEIKPPMFNELLINQHQSHQLQNPSFFLPLPHQGQNGLFVLPPAKRHNPGGPAFHPGDEKGSFSGSGQQEIFLGGQQFHPQFPHQLQLLPQYLQQRPTGPEQKPKMLTGDGLQQQQQQAIIDQLYKAAELVQSGNSVLAQGILARLNHHLSPIGKPFHRAAFYCKEALQLLLSSINSNNVNPFMSNTSPLSLVYKLGAYKSFSEISPLAQFANFTCTQVLLEALEGFDKIHIVDFDIGYGGQWASLMQELALKSGGASSLKITALVSPSSHNQLELSLIQENLVQFASEINIAFEFLVVNIESLNSSSCSLHVMANEAVAVNFPVSSLANSQVLAPLAFRFVKQLSPRIVVSMDRGCDRTDLPFASHIIHALQSYSNLLESLDAVNANLDAVQKIEKFLILPGFEKIVMGRFHSPEKTQHWRTLFLSMGFSPVMFSNFTESQAECVVKRTHVRGFQVEKRHSSLVLSWQQKELVSVSAWRCEM